MLSSHTTLSGFGQDSIRQIFDQSPDPYWIIDPESSAFLLANVEAERQLGFSLAELLQSKIGVVDVNLVVDTPEKWREVSGSIGPGQTVRYLADLRCKAGDTVAVEITVSRLVIDERPLFFAVTRDVSKIVAIEAQLKEREQQLQAIFQAMTEGVVVLDGDGCCVLTNPRAETLLDLPARSAKGLPLDQLVGKLRPAGDAAGQDGRPPLGAELSRAQGVCEMLLKTRHADHNQRWLLANSAPLSDAAQAGMVLTLTDVSELRRNQARVDYLSCTDQLTNLPNRGCLLSELAQMVNACRADGHGQVGLLVMDLDRFKYINDIRGHSVGDTVLLRVTDRLRAEITSPACLARLSADEFALAVPLPRCSPKLAWQALERQATRLAQAIRAPILTRQEPIQTSASMGAALTDGSQTTPEALLQYAELALISAKDSGGDCLRLFDPKMIEGPKARYYAEMAVRDGLLADEFELYLQPKVNMQTGHVQGAEALIRWNRLGQDPVEPAAFIGLAERSNLIVALGDWVVREACRLVRRLQQLGLGPLVGPISINVSPRQFAQSDFVARLKGQLAEAEVDSAALCIELTESALGNDTERVVSSLQQLARDGFGVSIDDFGSGYSSFAHLQRFVISEIKIDRCFVQDLEGDERGLSIVRAMLVMAKSLGLSVVSEGIETAEQLRLLQDCGCDIGQGYLFSRPLPFDQFVSWVRQTQH